MKLLITYSSRTGNTEKVAKEIRKEAESWLNSGASGCLNTGVESCQDTGAGGSLKPDAEAALETRSSLTFCRITEAPDPDDFDAVIVGLWIDKGKPNKEAQEYIKTIKNKKTAFFFTLGIQTFSDRGRQTLGRPGTGKAAYEKLLSLQAMGFDNVNIDIIYHYPRQTMVELDEDLKRIFSLGLGSFSFYSLISDPVPSNMDMGRDFKRIRAEIGGGMTDLVGGKTDTAWPGTPDPDGTGGADSGETDQALFDRIYTAALGQGFSLLELTKMSRHDPYRYISARHDGADTLALGAGAGGNLGDIVYMNPISVDRYRSLVAGEPTESERLSGILTRSPHAAISKLLGNLQRGRLSLDPYRELFGEESLRLLNRLLTEGYLETGQACPGEGARYRLTQKGVYWGNNICDAFLKSLASEFKSVCST